MDIIAAILSFLALACLIISTLIKGDKIKTILFLVFMGNLLYSISYFMTDSMSGAGSCLLGAIISIINYFITKTGKPIPKALLIVYSLAFVIMNLSTGGFTPQGIIAVLATLAFVMRVAQKNGAKYRLWTVANVLGWILYDVVTFAYGAMITHLVQLGITFVGMVIYDRKKEI